MKGRDLFDRSTSGGIGRMTALFALTVVLSLTVPSPGRAAEQGATTTTIGASTTTVPDTTTTTSNAPTTTVPGESTTTSDPATAPTPVGDDQLLDPPAITFPLVGSSTYRDTYGEPRDGGAREHLGTDIFADKGTPVVAVARGVVERIADSEDAGFYVVVRHTDGWRSAYVHLNNDSPGTDNGLTVGFAPGLQVGSRVEPGTLLGYVGDSGNAEDSVSHLHFELHQPDGLKINPYEPLAHARRVGEPRPLSMVDYDDIVADGTAMVGHVDTGTGFNAGLAAFGDYVFMGTWGNDQRCPGTGVRVVDVSDPATPEVVVSFADHLDFPNTSTPTLWVGSVDNPTFTGTIGVVGIQSCVDPQTTPEGPGFVGVAVFDLTDPLDPELLSVIGSGDTTGGVDALDVTMSGDHILIAASVPNSYRDTLSLLGAVRIIDITDPRAPRPLADWHPQRTGIYPAGLSIELERSIADSVSGVAWVAADKLIVGRESGELFELDLTDAGEPTVVGSVQWGDADLIHTTVVGQSLGPHGEYVLVSESPRVPTGEDHTTGRLLIVDADLSPTSTPAVVTSAASEEDDGEVVEGYYHPGGSTDAGPARSVVAWMSGGARVLDLSDPEHPIETGRFITPPSMDPQRWWLGLESTERIPMVWDVTESRGYFYALDHNSGLWVFTIDGIPPLQPGPTTPD